jgi:3-deoxy-manno-octulosonate cytidylyltransferase (CMP-KDO synthetase)
MDRGRVAAVVPARYDSTRFPGKPLALLLGRPMIAHVVERAREAGCFDEIAVATDDERIAEAARDAGALALMTGRCASGTDRVAEAARRLPAAVVVNVQGDEPAVPPESLRVLAAYMKEHSDVPVATLAVPANAEDLTDPNVVKVVCNAAGQALYFSRAPIPFPRFPVPALARRHVGLYAFQRPALLTFSQLPECDLERAEGLEQLRALFNGMTIQVLAAAGVSVSVDTPADVPRAEAALAALARRGSGARNGEGR